MKIAPLLHFIWVKAAMPLVAHDNLKAWCTHLEHARSPFEPLVWMDASSLEASRRAWQIVSAEQVVVPVRRWEDHGLRASHYLVVAGFKVPIVLTDALWASLEGIEAARPIVGPISRAVECECKVGLPQVASDLLRILVLFRFGGIYADMGGVQPGRLPFVDPGAVPFAGDMDVQPGFMRVGGALVCENALILADSASPDLYDVLKAIAAYYEGDPFARVKALNEGLAQAGVDPRHVEVFRRIIEVGLHEGADAMEADMRRRAERAEILLTDEDVPSWFAARVEERLKIEDEQLEKLLSDPAAVELLGADYASRKRAELRSEATREAKKGVLTITVGVAKDYLRALVARDSAALARAKRAIGWLDDYGIQVSHSIKSAGFGRFLELFNKREVEACWREHFEPAFQIEQVSYSWMTPGLSKTESVTAAAVVVQRAFREKRAERKEAEKRAQERATLAARARNVAQGLRETEPRLAAVDVDDTALRLALAAPGLRYRGKKDQGGKKEE